MRVQALLVKNITELNSNACKSACMFHPHVLCFYAKLKRWKKTGRACIMHYAVPILSRFLLLSRLRNNNIVCYLFFSRSRISVSSFSSADGSGAAGASSGSAFFFFARFVIPFIRRNTQKAIIRKSITF